MEIWVGNRFIRGRSGGMARVDIYVYLFFFRLNYKKHDENMGW